MTVAAIVVPFLVPRSGDLPLSPSDIDLAVGPSSFRAASACLILLLIALGATFVSFARETPLRGVMVCADLLLFLLLLASAVPKGRVRSLFIRLIGWLLAIFGLLELVSLFVDLWKSAADGETVLVTRSWTLQVTVNARDNPMAFWYSVSTRAVLVAFILYCLREYTLRIVDRRK